MWHNLNVLIGWLKKKWQNILKNPNVAMCHILKLPRVSILMCIVFVSVVTNVIARAHL
jgi:hypothetical protein